MSYWGSKTNTLLGSSLSNLEMKHHWEVLPSSKTCTTDQSHSQKLFTFNIAPERGKTDCESLKVSFSPWVPYTTNSSWALQSSATLQGLLMNLISSGSLSSRNHNSYDSDSNGHIVTRRKSYNTEMLISTKIFKMLPRNLTGIGAISSNIINFTE